jgi:hypothetical protein
MIRCCSKTSWMRSRRSSGHGAGRVGRASGQPSCTLIKATTSRPAGGPCAVEGSPRGLPGVGIESSQRLGRHRWKVERSLAWLLANRRLTIRYERRADILTAFLHLACALICARKLRPL